MRSGPDLSSMVHFAPSVPATNEWRQGELHRWAAGHSQSHPGPESAVPAVPRAPSGALGLSGQGHRAPEPTGKSTGFHWMARLTFIYIFMGLLCIKIFDSKHIPQNRKGCIITSWDLEMFLLQFPALPCAVPCLGRHERKHHARVGERRDFFVSEQQSFSAKKCSEVVPRCPQNVQTCCKTNGDSLPHACNIAQNAWVFSWKPQLHAGGFANSAPGGRGLGHTFADARVGPLLRILVVPVMIVAVVLTQGPHFTC